MRPHLHIVRLDTRSRVLAGLRAGRFVYGRDAASLLTGVPGEPGRHNCVGSAPRTTPAKL